MHRKSGALYLPETATCTLYLTGREAIISSPSKRKPSSSAAGKVYLPYAASVSVFAAKIRVC
jgi:hypothetical protein